MSISETSGLSGPFLRWSAERKHAVAAACPMDSNMKRAFDHIDNVRVGAAEHSA